MPPAKKILIVEDDSVTQEMLCDFLRLRGYAVAACASGPEALKRLRDTPCDLVISDLKMKPLDGIETMERIHAEKPALPVILISAFATPAVQREALQRGAAGFLHKPFSLTEIDALASKRIRRSRAI